MQVSLLHDYANKHKMTDEQVKEFYQIEKQLASRLRESTREERRERHLYTFLYDELFKRVPYHPQLTQKHSPEDCASSVADRIQFLNRFFHSNSTFVEVGSGDCSLSIEVAKYVKKVYAVDVSNEITKCSNLPQNFELVISDGVSIPVLENSVNIVYSDQLMEHLHPDDAIAQLQNIQKALVPGGIYICKTPHRLSGPHDVSQCFDEIATGFHLKEYLINELYQLFCQAGFSQINLYKSYKQIQVKLPLFSFTVFILKFCEDMISLLPFTLRRSIAKALILFRGITVVGTK